MNRRCSASHDGLEGTICGQSKAVRHRRKGGPEHHHPDRNDCAERGMGRAARVVASFCRLDHGINDGMPTVNDRAPGIANDSKETTFTNFSDTRLTP